MEIPDERYFGEIHRQEFAQGDYLAGAGSMDILSFTGFTDLFSYSDYRGNGEPERRVAAGGWDGSRELGIGECGCCQ